MKFNQKSRLLILVKDRTEIKSFLTYFTVFLRRCRRATRWHPGNENCLGSVEVNLRILWPTCTERRQVEKKIRGEQIGTPCWNRGRVLRDDQPLNFLLPAFYLSLKPQILRSRASQKEGERFVSFIIASPSETESNATHIDTDVYIVCIR